MASYKNHYKKHQDEKELKVCLGLGQILKEFSEWNLSRKQIQAAPPSHRFGKDFPGKK